MKRHILAILLATVGTAGFGLAADEHGHDHDHDHAKHDDKTHDDKKELAGHADEVKLTAEAVRANGITLATAKSMKLAATFTVPARVAFNVNTMAHVGSPVAGRVAEIKSTFGSAVKKNDELLVLESPELGEAQSDLIQKQAAVAVAKSAVRPAREAAERAKKLYQQNESVSLAELQKRQADLIAADGAQQTATAAAQAAENKLTLLGMDRAAIATLLQTSQIQPRFVLRAPVDGTVIQQDVTLGERVGPDHEALLILADTTRLWVWADVPEGQLAALAVGSPATLHTPAEEKIAGTVTLIAPQVSEDTRTVRVRIELTDASNKLRPGMFAKAEITSAASAASEAVIAVPEQAVQTVEGKPAVFVPVEGEPNTFAKREVEVGRPVNGQVPVRTGLKEGESFVATGSFLLKADLGKAGAAHEH